MSPTQSPMATATWNGTEIATYAIVAENGRLEIHVM
jgi:hypothetical protein